MSMTCRSCSSSGTWCRLREAGPSPAASCRRRARRSIRRPPASLQEETGLDDIFLEQLYTFGAVDRDPRERVVTVAYYALVNLAGHACAGQHRRPQCRLVLPSTTFPIWPLTTGRFWTSPCSGCGAKSAISRSALNCCPRNSRSASSNTSTRSFSTARSTSGTFAKGAEHGDPQGNERDRNRRRPSRGHDSSVSTRSL